MNYCPECGDLMRNRAGKYFCPQCNCVMSFETKYYRVELLEATGHDFMDKLNDVILFGGIPLFESLNVEYLPQSRDNIQTYHIFIAFEDKLHYENYKKLLRLEKAIVKRLSKNEIEIRYHPTYEDPTPKPTRVKHK